MSILVAGLLIFLGTHSIRIFAPAWRDARIAELGASAWKAGYSVASLLGFGLLIWGYALARSEPLALWAPPLWTRHLAALLTLPAFVLLAAAYVPGTHIKALLGHPMVLGVKLWAFSHLIANGTLADVLLFGGFLLWAIVDYASLRRRDRAGGISYAATAWSRDAIVLIAGTVAWAVFARFLHGPLIGVQPF